MKSQELANANLYHRFDNSLDSGRRDPSQRGFKHNESLHWLAPPANRQEMFYKFPPPAADGKGKGRGRGTFFVSKVRTSCAATSQSSLSRQKTTREEEREREARRGKERQREKEEAREERSGAEAFIETRVRRNRTSGSLNPYGFEVRNPNHRISVPLVCLRLSRVVGEANTEKKRGH